MIEDFLIGDKDNTLSFYKSFRNLQTVPKTIFDDLGLHGVTC